MIKQSNKSLKLNASQLEELVNIVNETLATDFVQPLTRVFTAADLWSIQRQTKNRTQRRHSF